MSCSPPKGPPPSEAELIMFKNWLRSLTLEQMLQFVDTIDPVQLEKLLLAKQDLEEADKTLQDACQSGSAPPWAKK